MIELLDPVAEAPGLRDRAPAPMGRGGGGFSHGRDAGRAHEPMDCTRLARAISEVLDAADPIEGE